jgi:hypothetical protein
MIDGDGVGWFVRLLTRACGICALGFYECVMICMLMLIFGAKGWWYIVIHNLKSIGSLVLRLIRRGGKE